MSVQELMAIEIFARKLVRSNNTFSMMDIKNEIRVVEKLCSPGTHKNIVSVLRHGQLSNMPYYFIDMELCDLDLETYNERSWNVRLGERLKSYPSEQHSKASRNYRRTAHSGDYERYHQGSGVYSSRGRGSQRSETGKW